MATEWYYQIGGDAYGPISSSRLALNARTGNISPSTRIRCGTSGAWISADALEGLFEARSVAPLPNPNVAPPTIQVLLIFVGIGLILAGAFGAVAAWNMNTTVRSEDLYLGGQLIPGKTVHNIGLMDERRNYLIGSSVAIIAGVLSFGFGVLATNQVKATIANGGSHCPVCNGLLDGAPQLCKHCRTELSWVDGMPLTAQSANELLVRYQKWEQQAKRAQYRQERNELLEQNIRQQEAIQKKAIRKQRAQRVKNAVTTALPRFDAWLKQQLGEDFNLIYRFIQILLYGVLPIVTILLIVSRVSR